MQAGSAFRDVQPFRHFGAGPSRFRAQTFGLGYESRLPHHVHELHFQVHAGLDGQHVAVDQRAHAVAAADEAFPVQLGQGIPELSAADAQQGAELVFRRQAQGGCKYALAHFFQQAAADAHLVAFALGHRFFLPKNQKGNTKRYYLSITILDLSPVLVNAFWKKL